MTPPDASQALRSKAWHPLTATLIETLAVIALEDLPEDGDQSDTGLSERLLMLWRSRSPESWSQETLHAWQRALAAIALAADRQGEFPVTLTQAQVDENGRMASPGEEEAGARSGLVRACAWLSLPAKVQATQGLLLELMTDIDDTVSALRLRDIVELGTEPESWRSASATLVPAVDSEAFAAIATLDLSSVFASVAHQLLYIALRGRWRHPELKQVHLRQEGASLLQERATLERTIEQQWAQSQIAQQSRDALQIQAILGQIMRLQTELGQINNRLKVVQNMEAWSEQAARLQGAYYAQISTAQALLDSLPGGPWHIPADLLALLDRTVSHLSTSHVDRLLSENVVHLARRRVPSEVLPSEVLAPSWWLATDSTDSEISLSHVIKDLLSSLPAQVFDVGTAVIEAGNAGLTDPFDRIRSLVPRVRYLLENLWMSLTPLQSSGEREEVELTTPKSLVKTTFAFHRTYLTSTQVENIGGDILKDTLFRYGEQNSLLSIKDSKTGSSPDADLSQGRLLPGRDGQGDDNGSSPHADFSQGRLQEDDYFWAFVALSILQGRLQEDDYFWAFVALSILLRRLQLLADILRRLAARGITAGPGTMHWVQRHEQVHSLLKDEEISIEPFYRLMSIPEGELIARGIERKALVRPLVGHDAGYYRVTSPDNLRDYATQVEMAYRGAATCLERCRAAWYETLYWVRKRILPRLRRLLEADHLADELSEDAPLVMALLKQEANAIELAQELRNNQAHREVSPQIYHSLALFHFALANAATTAADEHLILWWRGVEHFAQLIKRAGPAYWYGKTDQPSWDDAGLQSLPPVGDPRFWAETLIAPFVDSARGPTALDSIDARNLCLLMLSILPEQDPYPLAQVLERVKSLQFSEPRLHSFSQKLHPLGEMLYSFQQSALSEKATHLHQAMACLDELDRWRRENRPLPMRMGAPLDHFVGQMRDRLKQAGEEAERSRQRLSEDNICRCLELAGFNVEKAQPGHYWCMPTDAGFRSKYPTGFGVQLVIGEVTSLRHISDLHNAATRRDKAPSVGLILSDRHLPDALWETIRSYDINGYAIQVESPELFLEPDMNASKAQKAVRTAMDRKRNLFDVKNPVSGADFFGRSQLLADLRQRLAMGGEIVGLFGLRKMGKSSVLRMLSSTTDFPVINVSLQDIEPENGSTAISTSQLARKILTACGQALMRIGCVEIAQDLAQRSPGELGPLASLSDQLRYVLDRLPQVGKRSHLVICLDEIAVIVPEREAIEEKTAAYRQFAGTLRVLVEEDARVSLVVADLSPNVGRIHGWKTQQNPLYQKVTERWLLPMQKEDCDEMISYLCRRMGLDEEPEVLDCVFEASGGYPHLARQLCSLACTMLKTEERRLSLTIQGARESFLERQVDTLGENGLWGQITDRTVWGATGGIASTQLLQTLASQDGPVSKAELLSQTAQAGAAQERALKVLVERGVVRADGDRYWIAFGLLRDYIRTETGAY